MYINWITHMPDKSWIKGNTTKYVGRLLVQDWDGNLERTFLYKKDGEIIEYVASTKPSNKDANISKMGGWKNLSKTMTKKEISTLNSQNYVDTNGLNIEIDSLNLPFFSVTDFTNIYKDVDGNCWLNIREVSSLTYDGSGNIDGGGVTLYRERRSCGDDAISYPSGPEPPKNPGGGVGPGIRPGSGPGNFPHPPDRNCNNILYPEDYIGPKECVEELEIDCTGKPGGWAYESDCGCIGGTTGIESCPKLIKEIKVDSTARPCVDTIATAVISKAAEIQNVLSDLLSLANINASAAISTMANSSTYKIKIGENLFNDQTKYNSDGSSYLIRKNGMTDNTTGFIYLNKLMLNDGTDLAVAATLIHELMHSYMVYGIHHTTGLERDVFRNMNIFLFDPSGAPFSVQGTPQHIQMANTYVNSMAALLTSYATSRGILTSPDSSISLSEYCKDIFWQNLQHSQAYIAAPNKNRSASNGEREYKNTHNSTKKKKC